MDNKQTAPVKPSEVAEVIKAFKALEKADKKGATAFGLGLMAGLELAEADRVTNQTGGIQ